jgi:hypothetical protein
MPGVLSEGEIDFDVKPIDQHDVFRSGTHDDNYACWYTAALMLLSHRGARQAVEMVNPASLMRLYANMGIQPAALGELVDEAGMEYTPSKLLFAKKGATDWHTNLQRLGPLMVIVSHHAVVVRGIVNRGGEWKLRVNDPWDGMVSERPLYRFNGAVQWHLPMLYRRSVHRAPLVLTQPVLDPFKITY